MPGPDLTRRFPLPAPFLATRSATGLLPITGFGATLRSPASGSRGTFGPKCRPGSPSGLADGVLTIRHTEVPQAMSGRGIAGRLVAAAVEFARGHGYRVRPACEYAEVWMARHPEHDDLRA